VSAARVSPLRPFRHRAYLIVWSGAFVSNVGTWMETVAVGDLVASRTGEAGWTALVTAAGFLPMGLMGPIGGAIADRVDRRRFFFVTTLLQSACATTLTLLAAAGAASPGVVAVVVFVAGSVAGIGFPAYQAMLPDLVPTDDLLGAVSLGQAQFNLGRVVGPALAGIAISLGSYTTAFAINTVSFGAMLIALSALRVPPLAHLGDDDGNDGDPGGDRSDSVWGRIRTGARCWSRSSPNGSAAATCSSAGSSPCRSRSSSTASPRPRSRRPWRWPASAPPTSACSPGSAPSCSCGRPPGCGPGW
jgi:MFS family permease